MEEFEKYFRKYNGYFWEIEFVKDKVGGEYVYETFNGNVIAYANLVAEILSSMEETGAPPLGTLLLVLIATNSKADENLKNLKEFVSNYDFKVKREKGFFQLQDSFSFLQLISSLPAKHKQGENKKLLFNVLFKNAHNLISGQRVKSFLNAFDRNLDALYMNNEYEVFNKAVFVNDFRILALLKDKFPDVDSIEKALINAPDFDLKEKVSEKLMQNETEVSLNQPEFVDILLAHHQTFHIGSLIKNIWSGLSLPLHHNFPGTQPLGGVSDLTSKGDFDKLLISEFAYDDDTFISRLANRESLFIKREIPPQKNVFTRYILIDVSLYTWGNAKSIALAFAIAIAKHPKNKVENKVFIVGDKAYEVKLETIYDVININKLLNNKIDCSLGLIDFFGQNLILDQTSEVFLVSNEDALKIPDVKNVIFNYFDKISYVVSAQHDGGLSIVKHKNKRTKFLQHIHLPIEELWRSEKTDKTIQRQIEKIKNLPVLFASQSIYSNVFSFQQSYYMVENRYLYRFACNDFTKGFELIAQNIPQTEGLFMLYINADKHLILGCLTKSNEFVQYNIRTQHIAMTQHKESLSVDTKLFSYENDLYLAKKDNVLKKIDARSETFVSASLANTHKVNYFYELENFIARFKRNSSSKINKINVIKSAYITIYNVLVINDYAFSWSKFYKNNYFNSNFKFQFTISASLYLKNADHVRDRIELIKLLRSEFNYSLSEAHELINNPHSLLKQDLELSKATEIKNKIEALGAVAYTVNDYFYDSKGNSIKIENGVLVLKGSKNDFPIYISFILNKAPIMVAENYYAGNEYFLPNDSNLEKLDENEFYYKYVTPFIQEIIKDET